MKHSDIKTLLRSPALVALALFAFAPVAGAQVPDGSVSAMGDSAIPVPNSDPGPSVPATPREPDAGPVVAETPAAPVVDLPIVEDDMSAPPAAELSPEIKTSVTPLPGNSSDTVAGTNVMGDSGVAEKHSGTYYDADALVPDADLARAGATGTRKVDPALEPGQRYIVVHKNAGASSYEAQYTSASRALKLARYSAAMEMFENLYKKNHRDARVLMGLALAQQGAGFNESAAQTYEDLLKLQPNNANAIINLMGLMREQYPSVTLRKLTELRNKYPNNPGIPAQIGLVNAQLNNVNEALRYLEIAASMDPRNSSHVYNMAIIADRAGQAPQAIKYYERALQLDASYGDAANTLPRDQIYDRLVVLRRKV